ncbi:hypothetical protein [Vreelandella lionensis]|uniref:hypothetical protein n=1 Tax=Vreelandella lionensis TaxID=1144478 RepID=UPI001A9CE797|nr:hypothetical protein [Halomonas lionensis]
MKDNEYMNFSEDYELNHALKKLDKRQTKENRERLIDIGNNMKASTGKKRLQHGELREYAKTKAKSLE